MARINRTRTRRGTRRVIKKRTKMSVEQIQAGINNIINQILAEHNSIIVFLPARDELRRLSSKIANSEKNLRDFVESYVYEGDIYTVSNWAMRLEKTLVLKSLNGTRLKLVKGVTTTLNGKTVLNARKYVQENGDKAMVYFLENNDVKELKKVADDIISNHIKHKKDFIIFFPEDDEYLEQLPDDFSYDKDNIKKFIYNHMYEGSIDTLKHMKRGEKKTLNSLNGTPLNIEKNKEGDMFVNGIKIITFEDAVNDDISLRGYIINGVILP